MLKMQIKFLARVTESATERNKDRMEVPFTTYVRRTTATLSRCITIHKSRIESKSVEFSIDVSTYPERLRSLHNIREDAY